MTRSRIKFRSSSATAPMTVKIILPMGVDVSMDSFNETKSMPSELNSSSARTRCFVDRAKRSNLATRDRIEPPAPRISHQPVQLRSVIFRARDAHIDVLVGDGHAAVAGVLPKRNELRLWILPVILRRDSRV